MAKRAPTAATVAVAFSGGRDSLALLHVTCRAAKALGIAVVALHVHHGLLPEADGWLAHAQTLCKRWARRGWPVRLRWARLDGRPAPGESTEAWARLGRHAALARLAQEEGATVLLLAQHRRDQAETVLLQALRGGGPAGLAAMPRQALRGGVVWARPWLNQPREAIEAYVQRHRLCPLHDPSNDDPAFARNRLRLQVWPHLTQAFSDAEAALAAAARRAQEADAALAELAAMDLAGLSSEAGLQVAAWLALSPARRANALRAWLAAQPGVRPSDSLVQRLLAELPGRRAGQWPAGGAPHVCIALYRGYLRAGHAAPVATPTAAMVRHAPAGRGLGGGGTPQPAAAALMNLSSPGDYPVPTWGGRWRVEAVATQGVTTALLAAAHMAPRTGGERFALAPGGLPRSLKKQYQARGVPAAQRAGPLLWAGAGLVWAPGLGVDARQWAAEGTPQLQLRWLVDDGAGLAVATPRVGCAEVAGNPAPTD